MTSKIPERVERWRQPLRLFDCLNATFAPQVLRFGFPITAANASVEILLNFDVVWGRFIIIDDFRTHAIKSCARN